MFYIKLNQKYLKWYAKGKEPKLVDTIEEARGYKTDTSAKKAQGNLAAYNHYGDVIDKDGTVIHESLYEPKDSYLQFWDSFNVNKNFYYTGSKSSPLSRNEDDAIRVPHSVAIKLKRHFESKGATNILLRCDKPENGFNWSKMEAITNITIEKLHG
jgi:hypothetical protein